MGSSPQLLHDAFLGLSWSVAGRHQLHCWGPDRAVEEDENDCQRDRHWPVHMTVACGQNSGTLSTVPKYSQKKLQVSGHFPICTAALGSRRRSETISEDDHSRAATPAQDRHSTVSRQCRRLHAEAAPRTDQSDLAARIPCVRVWKDSDAHSALPRCLLDGPWSGLLHVPHCGIAAPPVESCTKVCKWCSSKATAQESDQSDSSSQLASV